MGEITKILFSFWLYPIISSFLIFILLINEFVRFVLNTLLWLETRGKVYLMGDGADGVWEYRTHGNTRMVVVCFVTKRGQLDNEKNCAKILEDRLFEGGKGKTNQYQKLQNIITRRYGYTCWKLDKSFHSRRHIQTLDRDFEYTEKDVINLLSQLTQDMKEDKPQWEWVILPKYLDSQGQKKSFQIFRFHHAYMDGMSGLMLVSKISENFKFILDPMKFTTPLWKKIYFYINCILFAPTTILEMYHSKYRTYWNRRRARARQRNHVVRGGRKFLAWTNGTIELETLKRIRFDTKASISTIVAFAFVEACRIVLPKKRLVQEVRVSEVIAFFPYPNTSPQNRFTAFTYPIGLEETKESIFQKLRTTQRNSLAGIGGPEPLLIYYVAKIAGRFSYHLLPYVFSGANSSAHLSNIPCAKEAFRFFNAECEDFMAFPPLPNDTGMCISSLSYKGGLKICGQADSSCLSENELKQIFQEIPKVIKTIARFSEISMPTINTVLVSDESDNSRVSPDGTSNQSRNISPAMTSNMLSRSMITLHSDNQPQGQTNSRRKYHRRKSHSPVRKNKKRNAK